MYRLPSGEYVSDPAVMDAAWEELAKPFVDVGFTLHSFDPGLGLMLVKDKKIVDNSHFVIPAWAAKMIGEALKEKRQCK